MASLEESIVTILTGNVALAALVGTRVEPAPKAQGSALPAISYTRVSTVAVHAHSGAVGLRRAWVQFDVWASSALSAQAVTQALHTALEHYRGTVGGVRIDAALSLNDRAVYNPETNSYRRIVEYYIWSNS